MGKRKAKVEVDSDGKKRIKVTVKNEAEASFNLPGSCMSTPVRGLKAFRRKQRSKRTSPCVPSKAPAGKICSVITIDDNDNEEAFRTIDETGNPDPIVGNAEAMDAPCTSVTERVEQHGQGENDVEITAEVAAPKPPEQEVIFLKEKSMKMFDLKRIKSLFKMSGKKPDEKAETKGYPFNPNQEVNINFTQTASSVPFRFLAHRSPVASTAAMRKGTSDRIGRLACKRREHSMANVFISPSLNDSRSQGR
jgi:hypothetical protein